MTMYRSISLILLATLLYLTAAPSLAQDPLPYPLGPKSLEETFEDCSSDELQVVIDNSEALLSVVSAISNASVAVAEGRVVDALELNHLILFMFLRASASGVPDCAIDVVQDLWIAFVLRRSPILRLTYDFVIDWTDEMERSEPDYNILGSVTDITMAFYRMFEVNELIIENLYDDDGWDRMVADYVNYSDQLDEGLPFAGVFQFGDSGLSLAAVLYGLSDD